ncbi:hypothetical protein ACFQ7B_05250 [Streptomyces erythrochromogenes]|uniref:hypothetical protein n=1 Tax=Streptomyces erythrochromogenes TaxID=285574 RepID=UPI0036C52A14
MPFDVIGETQRLLLNGLFTLVRLLVGLSGWASDAVFDFPVLRLPADPAQCLADSGLPVTLDMPGKADDDDQSQHQPLYRCSCQSHTRISGAGCAVLPRVRR